MGDRSARPPVLLTRRAGDNHRMSALFARHGLRTVSLPLIELEDTGTPMPTGPHGFAVFTSAAAVEALQLRGDTRLQPLPVFAVGERTAEALRESRYTNVRIGGGTAEALVPVILEAQSGFRGLPGLHVTGEKQAFDLAGALAGAGLPIDSWAIYRMTRRDVGQAEMEAALDAALGGAITVFSTESGRMLLQIAKKYGLADRLASSTLAGISANALAAFPPAQFPRRLVAHAPDAESLALSVADCLRR